MLHALRAVTQSSTAQSVICRVPRSQRGGEIIEPMVSQQWFVHTKQLAAPALDAVHSGAITVNPERFVKVYNQWLEDIEDWCISRQLWWGHRIPVWYCWKDEQAAEAAGWQGGEDWVVAHNDAEAQQLVRQSAKLPGQVTFCSLLRVHKSPTRADTDVHHHSEFSAV